MTTRILAIGILLFALAASVAHGAPATCEASGTLVDHEGNAIVGAKIIFTPTGNPETSYDGTTNKKGRYYVPGMFNPSSEGMWNVEIEAEEYLPISMEIETRTVNRVLIDDSTLKLNPNAKIPTVMIRAMGTARIDFIMSTTEDVAQAIQAAAAARAAEAGESAAAAPARRDPYDSALAQVSEGDLAGSVEFFEEAIADEPESAERHQSFAKVLYQLERYDEAEPQAAKALELEPDNVEMYMVLYSVLVGKGELESAEEVLRQAEEVSPGDPRIMQRLAYVASESGNTDAAIEAYEGLAEIDPQNTDTWLRLADLYAEVGAMERSAAAYEKVVELDPEGAPQVFFNLGALLINKADRTDEDSGRAVSAFRQALKLDPGYLEARKQLAFALLGTGDRAGAKTELEAYVALAPNAPDSQQMKALIQSLQ
jgi:tetratricopeptide (TPR) repeat protein